MCWQLFCLIKTNCRPECQLITVSKHTPLFHVDINPSATTLKPLTGDVNNIDYAVTVAPVKGWDIYSMACEQSVIEFDVLEIRKIAYGSNYSFCDVTMTGPDNVVLHFYADDTQIYLPLRHDDDFGSGSKSCCSVFITWILASLCLLSVHFRIDFRIVPLPLKTF